MSDKRTLDFKTVAEVAAEVKRLRAGYEKLGGTWTLEQTCWHCGRLLGALKAPVPTTEPTPEQQEARKFFDGVLQTRTIPDGRPTPPGTAPEPTVGPEAIDELLSGLAELESCSAPIVTFGRFGPVPTSAYRDFVILHTTHHLNFFRPTA